MEGILQFRNTSNSFTFSTPQKWQIVDNIFSSEPRQNEEKQIFFISDIETIALHKSFKKLEKCYWTKLICSPKNAIRDETQAKLKLLSLEIHNSPTQEMSSFIQSSKLKLSVDPNTNQMTLSSN
ncbi:hypothetical protein EIN_411460 [Entamoeba invadens IP1]|uniref:Uncharacterized protein n=1 Tax=Entamoeba invadens IP1 TaxID=370355 RepID=A0A0A1U190_ENTIV|nr:hypothetical protein EIN_411460 [Entamoeba invadens IP1]ELP87793.1 hypothetical protein EIN_411460 [Entamoeba invadens IP1]|eukprot:XP_004254564.1 hypothetical protein EIN_411460 [Entamoeba invadens IP1]